jgi:hypothetical protein
MPAKRLGMEYTSREISGSEGLGDESHTLWLLGYFSPLREKITHTFGAQEQIYGADISTEEEAPHNYVMIGR